MDRLKKRVAVLELIDRLRHLLNEEREKKREENSIPAPPNRLSSLENIKTKIPERSSSLSYQDQVEHQLPASSISNSSDISINSSAKVQQKSFVNENNGRKLEKNEIKFDIDKPIWARTLDKVKEVASKGWEILKETFTIPINRVSPEINTSSNAVDSARQTGEYGHQKTSLESQREGPGPNSQEMAQGRDVPQNGQQMQRDEEIAKVRDEPQQRPASARNSILGLNSVNGSSESRTKETKNSSQSESSHTAPLRESNKEINQDQLVNSSEKNDLKRNSLNLQLQQDLVNGPMKLAKLQILGALTKDLGPLWESIDLEINRVDRQVKVVEAQSAKVEQWPPTTSKQSNRRSSLR